MRSEQLKYFLSVARHLNFSEAAREYYITQPALSRQISELEDELGCRLFVRNTRSVTLTDSGEIFAEDAKRILFLEEAARARVRVLQASEKSYIDGGFREEIIIKEPDGTNPAVKAPHISISVGYEDKSCRYLLHERLLRIRGLYPQAKLSLHAMDEGDKCLEDRDRAKKSAKSTKPHTGDPRCDLGIKPGSASSGEYDLYIVQADAGYDSPDYTYIDLPNPEYTLVARSDHPLACLGAGDFDWVGTESFLMPGPETHPRLSAQIGRLCRQMDIHPRVARYFDSLDELILAAKRGQGVIILPIAMAEDLSAPLIGIPLLAGDKQDIKIRILWRSDNVNPGIRLFLEGLPKDLSDELLKR